MALSPGTRLGPYEVIGALGAGGMGEVYRATDTRLKRQVAIKILPEAVSAQSVRTTSGGDRLARFQREAEVLASLNHPNIAAIYGLEDLADGKALVMELVEGPTLADRIAERQMPVDEALSIARQIAAALEAAHEQGIVHRDLKPANIKVRDDGTVKVLDFGLAKLTDARPAGRDDLDQSPTVTSAAATAMGVILGTAAYMSPEQARGRPVDKRTDVWAFGAVLYEMLTRTRAFPGEDLAETIASVVKSTPDWTALPADVPSQVVTLIQRCLEKDRRMRIGDIAVAQFLLSEHATTLAPSPITTPQAAAQPIAIAASRRWRRAVPWALAAAGFVTAAVALTLRNQPRTEVASAPPVRFIATLPSDVTLLSSQNTTMPVVSPDGQRVAFVAARNGTNQIWVRSLGALEAQPVAGTEGGSQPFWSISSQTIAFASAGKIKTVEIPGGAVQTVCDAPSIFRGGTWNRDGVILFGSLTGGIFKVMASGGQPSAATTPDASRGESAHRFPSFLPDGRHFLYLAFPSNAIWIGSIDGKEARQLVTADSQAQYASPGYLLFVQHATLLAQPFDANRLALSRDALSIAQDPLVDVNGAAAFSASNAGTLVVRTGIGSPATQLTWADRGGKTAGRIGEPGPYRNPVLSPDGAHIAVETLELRTRTQGIWVIDSKTGEASKLTFDPHNNIWAVWSPDGSRVAFASDRQPGEAGLYIKPSNGSAAEQLLLKLGAETLAAPLSWSPDNQFLVFRRFAPFSNMALLPLGGNPTPRMFEQVSFNQAQGQVSPNGKWLAYHSTESGSNEVYVQSFPSAGAKWQVSKSGGVFPKWSRDGKELFYYAADGQLMVVRIAGEAALEIGPPSALFKAPLLNGPTPSVGFRAQYDVARDGRFLLNVPVGDTPSPPITVVLNWQEELKQRVPTR
jgi:serine/threonine protein kinase